MHKKHLISIQENTSFFSKKKKSGDEGARHRTSTFQAFSLWVPQIKVPKCVNLFTSLFIWGGQTGCLNEAVPLEHFEKMKSIVTPHVTHVFIAPVNTHVTELNGPEEGAGEMCRSLQIKSQ